MPLKVRRFCISLFLISSGAVGAAAQAPQATPGQSPASTPAIAKAPTAAEVMRDRLSKAKAYIAVRNYSAAIFELENIRRETNDRSVHAVANVLLMNSYLEQGDYKRAQDFLSNFYKLYKSNSANGDLYYASVAGQVVKGARNMLERYRGLGLTVSDRNLPLEAATEIERMRELLEEVVTQAKDLGTDRNKAAEAVALLDEATTARSILGRDDYDARRWRDAAQDAREQIASSRSVVINAVDGKREETTAVPQQTVAASTTPAAGTPVSGPPAQAPTSNTAAPASTVQNNTAFRPVASETRPPVAVPSGSEMAKKPETPAPTEPGRSRVVESEPKQAESKPAANSGTAVNTTTPPANPAEPPGPVEVGSLIAYATKQQAPTYPPAARSMRASGVVRVEIVVDENGDVAEVRNASGHTLLQAAAKDAVRKWKFRPIVRDGQPVAASGFVNFNFSL